MTSSESKPENQPPDPATDSSGDAAELTSDSDEMITATVKKVGRRWWSLRMLFLRAVLYAIPIACAILFTIYTVVRLTISGDDIKYILKEVVEEQTGGRIDIGNVQFNPLSGIEISEVSFFPPAPGDLRGFRAGGEVTPLPLANIDKVIVRYSIPRIFAGYLHITALQVVSPQLHLKQLDGSFNFQSILTYRKEKFSTEEEENTQSETGELKPPPTQALAYGHRLLFLPFDILASNIGVQNFRLDFVKQDGSTIEQVLVTSGLSVDMGARWRGLDSEIWISLLSSFEEPFEIDFRQQKNGQLKPVVSARAALNFRGELDDLRKIRIDYAMRALELAVDEKRFDDLSSFSRSRIGIDEDYQGAVIDELVFELGDFLDYNLAGTIQAAPDWQEFAIHMTSSSEIVLDELQALIHPFMPGLQASGKIHLEELRINGDLNLKELKAGGAKTPLPPTTGSLWLHDLSLAYVPAGIRVEPMSAHTSISVGPVPTSSSGPGSQIDISIDASLPGIHLQQKTDLGKVDVQIQDLATQVTLRTLWPQMAAPVVKINSEAVAVRASGPKIEPIDGPLFVDINGDGHSDLSRLGLTATVELAELLEVSGMAHCSQQCRKFRVNSVIRLDELDRLHTLATPLARFAQQGQVFPRYVSGSVGAQFTARGRLPDIRKINFKTFAEDAALRFSSQFQINNLNLGLPLYDVQLKDLNLRVLTSGDLSEQKLEVSQNFRSLAIKLPKSTDLAAESSTDGKSIVVDRCSTEVELKNELNLKAGLDAEVNPKKILATLRNDLKTDLHVGKIQSSLLPFPIADLGIGTHILQSNLESVQIEKISVVAPAFGIQSGLVGDLNLSPAFMPTRFALQSRVQVAHSGEEQLLKGLETSGQFTHTMVLKSDDMKVVAIDGEANFDDFNLAIDEELGTEVKVEGISGRVPMKQTVDLSPLLLAQKSSPVKPQQDQQRPSENEQRTASDARAAQETAETTAADVGSDDVLNNMLTDYLEKNSNQLRKQSNIVALVDYERIRAFYPDRRPLAIRRVEAMNVAMSRMEFDVEVRQNWFALNQFVINFLGGKLQGSFQLAFDPRLEPPIDPLKIGKELRLVLHMTRLDTRKLLDRFPDLKDRASGWNLFSNPYVDGTIHIGVDVASRDIKGGIEITSIGKDQLKMMLFYVDPQEQNPLMNDLRQYLTLGEVSHVSIPIKNGEIGLDVDVRVLGAPLPTPKLSRIPLRQIAENFLHQKAPDTNDSEDQNSAEGASRVKTH